MKTLILAAIRCSLMFTAVTASLFSTRPAQANYIVTLKQMGANVVATGSGAFDLTGLPVKARGSSQPLIQPFLGNIVTGSSSSNSCDTYGTTITGPSNFGIGIETGLVSIGTGDLVGMAFNGGHENESFLLVPVGYVSGTALSSSATYNNLTLGAPVVTPGTYVWTWGDGADQSFTLKIIGPVGVPGVPDRGSTVSLLGFGLLGLAALQRKLPLRMRTKS